MQMDFYTLPVLAYITGMLEKQSGKIANGKSITDLDEGQIVALLDLGK